MITQTFAFLHALIHTYTYIKWLNNLDRFVFIWFWSLLGAEGSCQTFSRTVILAFIINLIRNLCLYGLIFQLLPEAIIIVNSINKVTVQLTLTYVYLFPLTGWVPCAILGFKLFNVLQLKPVSLHTWDAIVLGIVLPLNPGKSPHCFLLYLLLF